MLLKRISNAPLFLFLFAIFPALSLLAWNIREVEWQIVIRPLVVSSIFLGIILGVFYVFLRDWDKSSFLAVFVFLLVFSYGHAQNIILNFTSIGKPNRFLIPSYLVIFLFFFWWVIFKRNDPSRLFPMINLISFLLVIPPIFQIISYQLNEKQFEGYSGTLHLSAGEQIPDIYYIILDGYNRADLLEEMGYDNSEFIDFLNSRGFLRCRM